jgi:hypothetical protein
MVINHVLEKEAGLYGLKVNPNETKTVSVSNKRTENSTFSGRTTDDVKTFLYLECVVTEEE